MNAVAVAALPDGTPVIVSGSGDDTVRVWRLTSGVMVIEPLRLPAPVLGVAVHRTAIIIAAGKTSPRTDSSVASHHNVTGI